MRVQCIACDRVDEMPDIDVAAQMAANVERTGDANLRNQVALCASCVALAVKLGIIDAELAER